MGNIILALFLIYIVGTCEQKDKFSQKANDELVKKYQTIESSHPGFEKAALQCIQFAEVQEQVGQELVRKGQDVTGYTRKEAYSTCMKKKGFVHLLK